MIRLENTFRVHLPAQEAWDLLTDLPRVAECMPGAHLDQVVDGEYRGGLATKIGPINARYRGSASFLEHDEVARKAVITARGREDKGSGSASATLTLALHPEDGTSTNVQVLTDLAISGRAAQFGRSLLAEVSTAMIDEFVKRLETMASANESGGPTGTTSASAAAGASPPPAHASVRADSPSGPETLDLARTLVLPLLRKVAVPLLAACAGGLVGAMLRRPRGLRGAPGTVAVPQHARWDASVPVLVCHLASPATQDTHGP